MRARTAVAIGVLAAVQGIGSTADGKIQDNRFLTEAYNQEAGGIRHIQTFQWDRNRRTWVTSFTQKWPTPRQNHQLSFMIPVVEGRRSDPVSGTSFSTAAPRPPSPTRPRARHS